MPPLTQREYLRQLFQRSTRKMSLHCLRALEMEMFRRHMEIKQHGKYKPPKSLISLIVSDDNGKVEQRVLHMLTTISVDDQYEILKEELASFKRERERKQLEDPGNVTYDDELFSMSPEFLNGTFDASQVATKTLQRKKNLIPRDKVVDKESEEDEKLFLATPQPGWTLEDYVWYDREDLIWAEYLDDFPKKLLYKIGAITDNKGNEEHKDHTYAKKPPVDGQDKNPGEQL